MLSDSAVFFYALYRNNVLQAFIFVACLGMLDVCIYI